MIMIFRHLVADDGDESQSLNEMVEGGSCQLGGCSG